MTVTGTGRATCGWCGQRFQVQSRRAPAPSYCSPSHRQRAYERRRDERQGIVRRSHVADDRLREAAAVAIAIEHQLSARLGGAERRRVSVVLDAYRQLAAAVRALDPVSVTAPPVTTTRPAPPDAIPTPESNPAEPATRPSQARGGEAGIAVPLYHASGVPGVLTTLGTL